MTDDSTDQDGSTNTSSGFEKASGDDKTVDDLSTCAFKCKNNMAWRSVLTHFIHYNRQRSIII